MATKGVLADLTGVLRQKHSLEVDFESGGGVEVVRRVREGAKADLLVLSDDAMTALDADGLLAAGTLSALFVSDVVAAVSGRAASMALATEDDLRAALLEAPRIAYSTGPSGAALLELIKRWDLVDSVEPQLIQAPPGVPVGQLLADGDADLGFQQRSELMGLAGVRILGPLPGAAATRSIFSGAVLASSDHVESARALVAFLGSRDAEEYVVAAGMGLADA